jgi:hypothetical protein
MIKEFKKYIINFGKKNHWFYLNGKIIIIIIIKFEEKYYYYRRKTISFIWND